MKQRPIIKLELTTTDKAIELLVGYQLWQFGF